MKVTFEYLLPEEAEEYRIHRDGIKYWSIMQEIDNWLRGEIKYNSDKYTDKEIELMEKIRTKINDEKIEQFMEE